jgi:hypothetical protein
MQPLTSHLEDQTCVYNYACMTTRFGGACACASPLTPRCKFGIASCPCASLCSHCWPCQCGHRSTIYELWCCDIMKCSHTHTHTHMRSWRCAHASRVRDTPTHTTTAPCSRESILMARTIIAASTRAMNHTQVLLPCRGRRCGQGAAVHDPSFVVCNADRAYSSQENVTTSRPPHPQSLCSAASHPTTHPPTVPLFSCLPPHHPSTRTPS